MVHHPRKQNTTPTEGRRLATGQKTPKKTPTDGGSPTGKEIEPPPVELPGDLSGSEKPSDTGESSDSGLRKLGSGQKSSELQLKSPFRLPVSVFDKAPTVWDQLQQSVETSSASGRSDERLSAAELSKLTPYSITEYILGAGHPKGLGWKGLSFHDRSGRDLGLDFPRFIASYGLALSDSCVKDPPLECAIDNARQRLESTLTKENESHVSQLVRKPTFDYRDYTRNLQQATQACKVNTSPLKLLAVAAALPSRFSEVIRDELLRDASLSPSESKYSTWLSIYDEMMKAEGIADPQARRTRVQEISGQLLEWYDHITQLLERVLGPARSYYMRPDKFTVVLRKWSNSDRYSASRPWEQSSQMERKLFNCLVTEHKVTIDWSCRRVLLADMVKATPRFSTSSSSAVIDLSGRLFLQELKNSEDEEHFQQKLIKAAQDLGLRTIDEFLQIESRQRHGKRPQLRSSDFQPENFKRLRSNPPPGKSFFAPSSSTSSSSPVHAPSRATSRPSRRSDIPTTTTSATKSRSDPSSRPVRPGSLREALGITTEESDRRWKQKLCSLCGSSQHRGRDCDDPRVRKLIASRSTKPSSSYPSEKLSSSMVSVGVVNSNCDQLCIRRVFIRGFPPSDVDTWAVVRAGLDTMCSHSLISRDCSVRLHLSTQDSAALHLDTVCDTGHSDSFSNTTTRSPSQLMLGL